MSAEKKGLLKSTIQITSLSVANILLSFITQVILAYYFGATPERDAYFAAMVIPTYISSVLIGSVGVMFLPIYVATSTKKSENIANAFLINAMSFCIFLSGVLVILMILFSRQIIEYTVPGFTGFQLILTAKLLVILLPTIIFQIITQLMSAVLQVQGKFVIPAFAPLLSTIIALAFVSIFSNSVGIQSLAYGTLIGSVIPCLVVLRALRNTISFRLTFNLANLELIKLIKTSAPLLIAGVFYRLTGVFERSIASTLSQGSISYLGYANQIMLILVTLTSTGIATAIYPLLSKAWSENNLEQLKTLFGKGIRIVLLMALPLSMIFIFWGAPIIQFIFERGAFTHPVTLAVSSVFSVMTIAFIATSLGAIIPKIFYFSGNTIFASVINCLETLVYLYFAYQLSQRLNYRGLAIALCISTSFNVIISFIWLLVRLRKTNFHRIILDFLTIPVAAFVPSILLYIFFRFLRIEINSSVLLTGTTLLLYFLGYFYSLKILRISEIDFVGKRVDILKYKLRNSLKL